MKELTERDIHNAVCDYIRKKYPDVIFTSESSGIKLTIGQAKQLKRQRSCSKLPDLIILKSKLSKQDSNLNFFGYEIKYAGMLLEIKKSKDCIFKKNGDLRINYHIESQRSVLEKLTYNGYYADFGLGIDDCIKKIDWYLAE